ncbi:MAG: RsmB/NOP family class I SAM-dependent RNA methyltransferase, partial [Metallosphaera sp.]
LTLRDRDKVENFSKLQKLMIKEAFNISFKKAVYSVCSIFPEEGEVIMDEYVDKLMTTDVGGIEGYGKYKSGKLSRRYFGHIHGTEDFFIATLRGVS